MNLRIKLANQVIDIHARYDRVCHMCENYITTECPSSIEINITDQDLLNESTRFHSSQAFSKAQFSEISLETTLIHRRISEKMLFFSTFLMHGSVVSDGTYSYMFSAPSGTGKTARTYLFLKNVPNSFVINGDKPLLIVEKNRVLSCGTPWCGKEGMNTNTIQPLTAIFFIERAKQTTLTELTFSEAFPKILEQTYRPSDPYLLLKTIDLIRRLEGKVKFYQYRSSLDDDSVLQAWHTAKP